MKEHTMTKTLFKIEKKKKSRNYNIEGLRQFGGQYREMDLVTFASILWTQNDSNFAVLSPAVCPLSSLFFGVFFSFFCFIFGNNYLSDSYFLLMATSDTFLDLQYVCHVYLKTLSLDSSVVLAKRLLLNEEKLSSHICRLPPILYLECILL